MKKIKLFLFAIFVAAFTSCSKDSNEQQETQLSQGGDINATPFVDPGVPTVGKFTKNLLIEDYTGTWCGFCPRIAFAIEKLKAASPRVISVAIHGGGDGNEPFTYRGTWPFNPTGFPTGMLNRKTEWGHTQATNAGYAQALGFTGPNAELGLALKSSLTGNTLTADINVKFATAQSNLKVVLVVVEDGLVYNQANYTDFYTGPGTIQNFVHNDVLRASVSDIFGDAIENGTANATVTKSYTFNMSNSNVTKIEKAKLVAFVVDNAGNVINTRKANIGDDQTFQQNQ